MVWVPAEQKKTMMLLTITIVYTCRRRGSMVRCKPWSRWQDCPRVQGCTRGGTELPPKIYLNDFQHDCWILSCWTFFFSRPEWGSTRWGRGLLKDKEPCSPWRSALPRTLALWGRDHLDQAKHGEGSNHWKENPKPDGNAKIDGAPDNENALTRQPGFDKSSCIHCWERHAAPWPWPWTWPWPWPWPWPRPPSRLPDLGDRGIIGV